LVARLFGINDTLALDHAFSAHNLDNASMQSWKAQYSIFCRPFTLPSSIMISMLQSAHQLERDHTHLDNTVLGKPSHFTGTACMTRSASPLLIASSWPGLHRRGHHISVAATSRQSQQVHVMALGAGEDPWLVLGVPSGSSMDFVRKTYRMRAKREHPDVSNAPDATETWAKISDAYEILSDPQRLQEFYAKRIEWQRENQPPEPVTPWSKAMKDLLVGTGILPSS
jgi:hypothetical protein